MTTVIDTGCYKAWTNGVLPDVDHVIGPEKLFAKGIRMLTQSRLLDGCSGSGIAYLSASPEGTVGTPVSTIPA